MSNADLIHQFREADLPEDLRQLQEQVIEFATALRPVYPADEVYLVDFAEPVSRFTQRTSRQQ